MYLNNPFISKAEWDYSQSIEDRPVNLCWMFSRRQAETSYDLYLGRVEAVVNSRDNVIGWGYEVWRIGGPKEQDHILMESSRAMKKPLRNRKQAMFYVEQAIISFADR